MKGLILKDLYVLKGYGKQYLLTCGAMIAYALFMRTVSFVMIYFIIMSSSVVLSTMTMDEAVSFHKFALTMPINIRTVIKSKYAVFLITIGAGAITSMLLNILLHLFPIGIKDAFESEGLAITVTLFILVNAVSMPVMFRLGTEKARYVNIFIMLAAGGIILGGVTAGKKAGISFDRIEEIPTGALIAVCIVVAALAMIISYFVAVKVSKNKEL